MPSGKISASAIAVSGALLRGTIKVFANKYSDLKSVAERCSLRSHRIVFMRLFRPLVCWLCFRSVPLLLYEVCGR